MKQVLYWLYATIFYLIFFLTITKLPISLKNALSIRLKFTFIFLQKTIILFFINIKFWIKIWLKIIDNYSFVITKVLDQYLSTFIFILLRIIRLNKVLFDNNVYLDYIIYV